MTKARKSFLLRLDPALYDALERWAQQELRSVNGQIEFLLRQEVIRHKRIHEEPPAAQAEPRISSESEAAKEEEAS